MYSRLRKKFDEYRKKANIDSLSKESLRWFYRNTSSLVKTATFNKTLDAGRIVNHPIPGRIYLYRYVSDTPLPYYDTMPLVLVINHTENGWIGINFHYMPPISRLIIMEVLYETITNPIMSNDLKIRTNWEQALSIAKRVSADLFLKHSIKRYLSNHLASPILEIYPEHWSMCLFLPLARFKKKKESYIWNDI